MYTAKMQHYLLITVLYYTNNKILATYLKVLMERSWAQKFKHQTIVTLKAENILEVQNICVCQSVQQVFLYI